MNDLAENKTVIDMMLACGSREDIFKIQAEVMGGEQVDCPITNFFIPGVYARAMEMKRDEMVVGKIHKHKHFCILAKGSVIVVTEKDSKRLSAPAIFVADEGAKRVIFALEDSVWINIHRTDETDLGAIERDLIAISYDEIEINASATKEGVR